MQVAGFSARQTQVASLIAAGYSNEEVAVELGITVRTARAHSDILREKLGVPHRRQIPMAFRHRTGSDLLAEDGLR
jgi:DNA-binding CsgD family transcriptional regulator